MKLYLAPGACSLSPHIALREAGLAFDAVRVDFATKQTSDGQDFLQINPKGYVPALETVEGYVLTEGPAIVQYIADRAPASKLAPANGTLARYQLQESLGYIGTELHKAWGPLWNGSATEDAKNTARANIGRRLGVVETALSKHAFLTGDTFTVADGYLFTVLGWAKYTGVDLSAFPHILAWQQVVAARPAVVAALEAEKNLRPAK